jgi:hypothetical protein
VTGDKRHAVQHVGPVADVCIAAILKTQSQLKASEG